MADAIAVAATTRVTLYPLRCVVQAHECHLGRPETGEFVALPTVAAEIIDLFDGRRTIADIEEATRVRLDIDIDVADLVVGFLDVGFVSHVDGVLVPGGEPMHGSLPWITPTLASWSLRPAVAVAIVLFATSGAIPFLTGRAAVPSWEALVWSSYVGLVVVINAALGWFLVFLHEMAHLVTARGAGAPARMSLGNRLQFLVAQTDVSGIRGESRRVRLTVYLSGIALNLAICAAAAWVLVAAEPGGPVHRIAAGVWLMSLLMVAPQFLVFMRTDLYFVVADLSGVADLYPAAISLVRRTLRSVPVPSTVPARLPL